MSSPGGILNALATALHGSIRTAPGIHRLRLGLLGYLIPFAPLAFVSQCQCRPSRVLSPLVFFPISTHFTAPPEIPSAPTVLQLVSRCLFLRYRHCFFSEKKVHDPWAFYLHAALLRQAFAHCGKFPTAASRRSLGRVSVPLLPHQLANQTRAPPRADSSFCSSAYGRIRNCLSFQGITCIHALHISLEFAPSNIAIPTLSRQSHEPLIHSHSITAGEQVKIEKLTLGLGIIRLELMTSTTSRLTSLLLSWYNPIPAEPPFSSVHRDKM
ncbi:hypothetical protein H6P81_021526 [Aristolochia fimbriata]|uniref:Uncharacterized protein n=1 Tax=Aristolochia fimbriata TaxID=158543 RepID=A0AAV7DSA5_ARIFI|nr:hypothetical protein H6P81_021526 [Aristolochia fimbriata]